MPYNASGIANVAMAAGSDRNVRCESKAGSPSRYRLTAQRDITPIAVFWGRIETGVQARAPAKARS